MVFVFLSFVAFIASAMADTITTNIVGGCDDGMINYFYPVFEINSYTCESGFFLPAGATKCVPCPVDHNCGGGTYTFNKTKAQGIILNSPFTKDITNVCGDTLANVFFPIFEPNDININWIDDNGNVNQTTCTYDLDIVLPPEPTQAGYTFKGWKLEKQN